MMTSLLKALQSVRNLSGVNESSRGYGASLAEALDFRRAQLEALAACASQGAIDSLRNRELPRHPESPALGFRRLRMVISSTPSNPSRRFRPKNCKN